MQTTKTQRRAAIMSRVSSDEQAKGYSLDVQEEALLNYCKKNDIEVVYVFREDHSAKSFNRPAFKEFINFLKSKKEKVDLLIFTSWDRFSRHALLALNMIDLLKKYNVSPFAIEQPLDLNVPQNLLLLHIYLSIPEVDNIIRSRKIKSGMRGALKTGRWSKKAVMGYNNERDSNNKPIIVINKDAPFIRYIFEAFSANMSQTDIRIELQKQGFKVSKSKISILLRNPVYAGKIVIPADENETESVITGIHEPIISEKLYYLVQEKLKSNYKSNKRTGSVTKREELPLRGSLLCPGCENHITGSASRGKSGKRHFYYHCNACKIRFKAEKANETITDILSSFKFNIKSQQLFEYILNDKIKSRSELKQNALPGIRKKTTELENKINSIQDLLVEKKLSYDEYLKMKKRYEVELEELQSQISTTDNFIAQNKNAVNDCLNGLKNIDKLYQDSSLDHKRIILGSIFPDKLIFDGEKCRTPKINPFLSICLNITNGLGGSETKNLQPKLEISSVVVRRGIEPLCLR